MTKRNTDLNPSDIEHLLTRGDTFTEDLVDNARKMNNKVLPNDSRNFIQWETPKDVIRRRNLIASCISPNSGKWFQMKTLKDSFLVLDQPSEYDDIVYPKFTIGSILRFYFGKGKDFIQRQGTVYGLNRLGQQVPIVSNYDIAILPKISKIEVPIDPSKKEGKKVVVNRIGFNNATQASHSGHYFEIFDRDLIIESQKYFRNDLGENKETKLYWSRSGFTGSIKRNSIEEFCIDDFPSAFQALKDQRARVTTSEYPGQSDLQPDQ